MKIYIDTSTLFKLYHEETGSKEIDDLFENNTIKKIYISEIAKIEFVSTVWKKIRMNEINETNGYAIIALFKYDLAKFTVIKIDVEILELAEHLFSKFGMAGLRTLDSIQLASAISVKEHIQKFVCADKLLDGFFRSGVVDVSH